MQYHWNKAHSPQPFYEQNDREGPVRKLCMAKLHVARFLRYHLYVWYEAKPCSLLCAVDTAETAPN